VPIKRELEARSTFIPPYLSNFAPYQLSSGCSCSITPLLTPVSTIVAEAIITTYLHATVPPSNKTLTLTNNVLVLLDHRPSSNNNDLHNPKPFHNNLNSHNRRPKLLPHKRVHPTQFLLQRRLGKRPRAVILSVLLRRHWRVFELSDGPRTYVQLFGDCRVAGLGRDSRDGSRAGSGGRRLWGFWDL